ncbi:DUF4255 domain-containing protein [Sulfurovum sp. bin170]|uniref:DUF4255 domain-containing protein n=1 Tax=Sulfurovum sp. bin170 TaxID=2695268 RepID=UPI0013DF050F|nr:DUF4255 domain-containing protein [Sulfurovum sp. bin170]NEW60238.1 DUF4255 domain-containing protein [Sulfurovum sp. bin170]
MITLNDLNDLLKSFFEQNIATDNYKVSFYPPLKDNISSDDKTIVNVYLFDIRENIEYKTNQWEFTKDTSKGYREKPPTILDMFYMITVYGTSNNIDSRIEEELQMLSYLLPIIYDNSYIAKDDVAVEWASLFDQLPDNSPRVPIESIHPKFLDEQGGFQIWSSFEQHLKPAIYLKLTAPILFDKFEGAPIVVDKKMTLKERENCN